VDGKPIAICNLGADGFRAIDAVCSHEHYFLDEGEVDADLCTIECPKHGSTFDLNTGKPRTLPAVAAVSVYDVTTKDSDILIEV
jgi:3-phenylpropionate/trans-cinnamate dioxygenase ferredoxin subunit